MSLLEQVLRHTPEACPISCKPNSPSPTVNIAHLCNIDTGLHRTEKGCCPAGGNYNAFRKAFFQGLVNVVLRGPGGTTRVPTGCSVWAYPEKIAPTHFRVTGILARTINSKLAKTYLRLMNCCYPRREDSLVVLLGARTSLRVQGPWAGSIHSRDTWRSTYAEGP